MVSVWMLLKRTEGVAISWEPMLYESDDQFHVQTVPIENWPGPELLGALVCVQVAGSVSDVFRNHMGCCRLQSRHRQTTGKGIPKKIQTGWPRGGGRQCQLRQLCESELGSAINTQHQYTVVVRSLRERPT